jgi:hypothetical protein
MSRAWKRSWRRPPKNGRTLETAETEEYDTLDREMSDRSTRTSRA